MQTVNPKYKSPNCITMGGMHDCTIKPYTQSLTLILSIAMTLNTEFKSGYVMIHLGCPELKDLMMELRTVDWYELGIQLDVPADQLGTIDRENPTEARKMAKVLQYWLSNETASWEKVITALERIGGYGNIVATLQSNYSIR